MTRSAPRGVGRRVLRALLIVAVAFAVLVFVVGCLILSGPHASGPPSDHFDGKRFRNMREVPHHGFGDFLKWRWSRAPGPWNERTSSPPGPRPPERISGGGMRVTFVNHATTLVQMDGVNVLTDPIWSERASPVSFAGPRRQRSPGLRFEDLPPIHAVVVSHNHYDHMDLPTLRRLSGVHGPRFFVGRGNAPLLLKAGIHRVIELDWWQTHQLTGDVTVTGVPAQHFSQRGLCDRDRTLWLGYAMRGPAGLAYFAGDTGAGPHFAEIAKRLGPPRLAILPIGAYRPEWFMSGVHVSPEEAVVAHETIGAGTSVGMHFGTFKLADDGQDEPTAALEKALAARKVRPRFSVLEFGAGLDVPPDAGGRWRAR